MIKPVILRSRAERDVDDTLSYLLEREPTAAASFVDALEAALVHLDRHPLTGSPRFAYELDLPDLRAWPIGRHPYLVFYVDRSDHIDVWRVIHSRRDLPSWLRDDDREP